MESFLLRWFSAPTIKLGGLWLIVLGLVADGIVILWVPSGPDKPLSFTFDIVIALGVWIEHVGAHATETLSKRTRREILSGKTSLITERLRPFAGTQFDCGLNMNSGEQMDFWYDLEPTLKAAGWEHLTWNFPPMIGGILTTQDNRPASGSIAAQKVEIHLHPKHRQVLLPAASALIVVLGEIGIAAMDSGFNAASANENAIHILIGDK